MITSSSNPQLKYIQQLAKKARTRREDGVFLVEGPRMFYEAPKAQIKKSYLSERFYNSMEDRSVLEGTDWELVEDSVFDKMSATMTPQGVLCVLRQPSYKMEDLRQMHEANNEEIRKLLQRYEKKMEAPTDRVVFQLIVLGLRAELQQMVSDLEYGELSRAQVKLHLTVGKYLKIVSFAGLTSTEAITDFVSEYETLLKEILRLEDAYLERRTDFEKHQKIFGNKDGKEESAE